MKLFFGFRGNPGVVCVDFPVCLFWLAEVASAWIYLSTQRCSITEVPSSVNSPYTITNLVKS